MASEIIKNTQQLPPLTKRQKEVLDIITDQFRKTKKSPTIRDLADTLGLSSPASVHRHLTILEKKGYINLRGRSHRVNLTVNAQNPDCEQLTDFERQALDFITLQVTQRGVSPTIRQIVEGLDTSSIGKVHTSLRSLEEKNYITLRDNKQYLSLVTPSRDKYYPVLVQKLPTDYSTYLTQDKPEIMYLPLALLIDSFQESDAGNILVVRPLDNSLVGVGIFKDDYLLVRKREKANVGDIVVVKYQQKVILRSYQTDKTGARFIRLAAANKEIESIKAKDDEISILGIGVGLVRRSFSAIPAHSI